MQYNKLKRAKILSTGSYTPSTVVTNKQLELDVQTSDNWIQHNLGIKERRIASVDEYTSDLAAKAGLRAINHANLRVQDIELIIVATATPDRLAPSTACIVQDKLHAYNAACFDISAVCSGFLYALTTASQFISTGMYKHILAFKLYSDGRGKHSFTIPGGGSEYPLTIENANKGFRYFQMQGSEVYNTGIKVLPQVIREVLDKASMSVSDIDYLIPHQPSIKILQKTAEALGLPFEKVMTNMDRYANTSSGTIPILLDEVNKAGKLTKNTNIIIAAVGSGWTWGAAALRWS